MNEEEITSRVCLQLCCFDVASKQSTWDSYYYGYNGHLLYMQSCNKIFQNKKEILKREVWNLLMFQFSNMSRTISEYLQVFKWKIRIVLDELSNESL